MVVLRQAVAGNVTTQGWTSGSNDRGSFDVISSCLLTLFLCCWSQLVINVPSPGSSDWSITRRKFFLLCINIAAPEIIFQTALGQWISARRAQAVFQNSGFATWTIRHTFYVNMGGLHLCTPDWKPFPINAMQLHYLIINGYVNPPHIESKHIRDKNKVDRTLRIIACLQLAWFITNLIARAVQGLAITLLELSTSAFVGIGAATSFFWMLKPADVQSPDYLYCDTPLAKILCNAGDAVNGLYYFTPLDFIAREEWTWSIMWNHGLNYLRRLNIASPSTERPITRFSNTVVTPIRGKWMALLNVITTAYATVFLAGWHFQFPTRLEQTLWRVAALTSMATSLAIITTVMIPLKYYPSMIFRARYSHVKPRSTEAKPGSTSSCGTTVFGNAWAFLRNSGYLKDPAFDAPPELIISTWLFGLFYCTARAYIIIADVIEFRSLPVTAYKSPSWSLVKAHF